MLATEQPPVVHLALALIVACPSPVVRRCRKAAARARILVRETEIADAAGAVERWKPLAVIVTERIYGVAPGILRTLSRHMRTALVIAPDDIAQDELECALVSAVWEGWTLRHP